MAYIRKRGDSYQAQIGQGDSRKQKTFKTKWEAERWALSPEEVNETAYTMPLPDAVVTADSRATMRTVLQRYLDEVIPTTADPKKHATEIAFFMANVSWMDIPLHKLTSKHLTLWRDQRYEKRSAKTVHTNFTLFKTALNYDEQTDALELFRKVVLKPITERFVARLESDEQARLLKAANTAQSRYLPHLIIFAIETAMRRGEMLKLEWRMVDLERSKLHLPASITKTAKPRTIKMSPHCKQALLTMRALDEAGKLVYRKNPRFKTDEGKQMVFPITPDGLRKTFETARAKAGLDYLHWHDLRHEGCSRLFEKGLTVTEVQSVSGHNTIEELSRYSHANQNSIEEKLAGEQTNEYAI